MIVSTPGELLPWVFPGTHYQFTMCRLEVGVIQLLVYGRNTGGIDAVGCVITKVSFFKYGLIVCSMLQRGGLRETI